MKKSKIEVNTSGAALGAVIQNINLRDHLFDEEKKTLCKALDDHEVIFSPSQNLDPNQQKEVTRIFGPLLPSYIFFDHLDDDPEIEVVIKDKDYPKRAQPVGTRI